MIFRLHSRLVFWNLLIIGLIGGILGYYLTTSVRDHIEAQIEERLTQESALGAAYLSQAPADGNLQVLAGNLGKMLDARVTIIAHDGRVLGDSDLTSEEVLTVENHSSRPEVVDAEQHGTGTAVRYSSTVRVNFIYVARKLGLYVLRVAMPLSALDTLMAALRSQLLFAMLIAVGVTIAFGYFARGLISVPLRNLSAASKKLAAGDLDQRLPISGDEEIAALGAALNTMAKNLSAQMQALSEGKQRLESIVGAMTEGVMVLDGAGKISLTNRALHHLLESERNLAGKTPFEVFRIPALEEAVRRVSQGRVSEVIEFHAGNGRVLQANVAPVPSASGPADAVVIVFHDLTEIRRTERMRRDFVANVSHEFKTPLTSIRGYAETLLSGAMSDPKNAGDFVRIIERNAKNLEALVTDLLMLARLEAELPVAIEPINVRTVIDEQLASRQSAIAERQISVSNDCPPDEIRSDRTRLSPAVSNLIDNAIYYNRPKGEIRITGEVSNGSFQLSIADTGQGIPTEELPRIFERFYRIDKARSRETGRTGLGLSIVKHAIESLGGSITVVSRLGSGSTFTIKLPKE